MFSLFVNNDGLRGVEVPFSTPRLVGLDSFIHFCWIAIISQWTLKENDQLLVCDIKLNCGWVHQPDDDSKHTNTSNCQDGFLKKVRWDLLIVHLILLHFVLLSLNALLPHWNQNKKWWLNGLAHQAPPICILISKRSGTLLGVCFHALHTN